jgi:hypothetical protein
LEGAVFDADQAIRAGSRARAIGIHQLLLEYYGRGTQDLLGVYLIQLNLADREGLCREGEEGERGVAIYALNIFHL